MVSPLSFSVDVNRQAVIPVPERHGLQLERFRRHRQTQIRTALEQRLDGNFRLHAGKERAEAEMVALRERQVLVRVTTYIESLGILEDVLIVVG